MADADQDVHFEDVRVRSERLQRLVDNAVAGMLTPEELVSTLQDAGATRREIDAVMEQVRERVEAEEESEPSTPERGWIPDNPTEPQGDQPPANPDPEGNEQGEDDTFWASVMAQVGSLRQRTVADKTGKATDGTLAALLGSLASSSKTTVSDSVLRAVPGLSLISQSSGSEHLDKTFQRREVFASEKSLDPLIDLLQRKRLDEPIPRTIWRDIIQDRLVNFEKLFATMDSSYNHNDDVSDFHAGYALVKKDHISAKKPLVSEADWIRVFGAWEAAVIILYEHRKTELQGYRRIVNEVFRAAPHDPLIAIRFDAEMRDRYSRAPFCMDDRIHTNAPLLTEMFKTSSRTLGKRTTGSPTAGSVSKRATVVCLNWNFGRCSDPCANRRKHGSCSECAAEHRAKDNGSCFASLQARRGSGTSDRSRASTSGGRGD